MDLPSSFRSWLISRRYSGSTVRNYLSDINHYLSTLPTDISPTEIFNVNHLSSFFRPLTADSNLSRYLASLNLFCQFAVDQKIILVNPLATTRKQLQKPTEPSLNNLLNQYQSYLESHHHTPSTIRNYLTDLKRYLLWLNPNQLES